MIAELSFLPSPERGIEMAKSSTSSESARKTRKPIQRTAFGAMKVIDGRMAELSPADQSAVASWFKGKYLEPIKMIQGGNQSPNGH